MSEFLVCQMTIKTKEEVREVLDTLGLPYEEHETPVALNGFQGDVRDQKANIVVRRKHVGGASNDLGFLWNPQTKEYELTISRYDKSKGNAIRQTHAFQKVNRIAKKTRATATVEEGECPQALQGAQQTITISVQL